MASGITPNRKLNNSQQTLNNESTSTRERLAGFHNARISPDENSTMPVLDVIKGAPMGDKTGFTFEPFINCIDKKFSVDEPLNHVEMRQLKTEIQQIKNDFNKMMRGAALSREKMDLAKAVYIYNHILKTVAYDEVEFAEGGLGIYPKKGSRNSSAYGALVKGVAVCSGISDAIHLLATAMGLECKKVLASHREHSFNMIKVGNRWYRLDATYEINRFAGGKIAGGKFKFDWFLRKGLTPRPKIGTVAGLEVYDAQADMPSAYIKETMGYLGKRGLDFDYSSEPPRYFTDPARGIRAFAQANGIRATLELVENLQKELIVKTRLKIVGGRKPHIELTNGHLIVEHSNERIELAPNSGATACITLMKTKGEKRTTALLDTNGNKIDRNAINEALNRIEKLLK